MSGMYTHSYVSSIMELKLKIKSVLFILMIHSYLFSQEISFNEDSLYYIPSAESYGDSDTLWMYNSGAEELVIDSAYSVNRFGYNLKSIYADSIFEFDYIYDDTINIRLPAQDSIMLIISNPDRCPVCKLNPNSDIFQDTIIFINNSVNEPYYRIFAFISEYLSLEDDINIPIETELSQNCPNPFNPKTTIEFYLSKPEHVILEVFNSLGQKVKNLVSEKMSAGKHSISFDGNDFSSGTYLYKMSTHNFTQTMKMLLLK